MLLQPTTSSVTYHVLRPRCAVDVAASVSFTEIPLPSKVIRYSSHSTVSHSSVSCCPSRRQAARQPVAGNHLPTSIFQSDRLLWWAVRLAYTCRSWHQRWEIHLMQRHNCPSSVVSQYVNGDLVSLLDTHDLRQFVASRTTRRLQQLAVQLMHDVVTWLFSQMSPATSISNILFWQADRETWVTEWQLWR